MNQQLHNYEIVKRTLEHHKKEYLRKGQIAHLTGLSTEQVSKVIKAAWRLGWVSRIETRLNNNAFGRGRFPAIRTAYKIKRFDSWMGFKRLYTDVVERQRERRELETAQVNK